MCHVFFDTFSMGIDTILFCTLIDLKENDGSVNRPYFMSKKLKEIFRLWLFKFIKKDKLLYAYK